MTITHAQAAALRTLANLRGMVRHTPESARAVFDLISTTHVAVIVTADGFEALREYDEEHANRAAQQRIALGMAQTGRAALARTHAGGDRDGQ